MKHPKREDSDYGYLFIILMLGLGSFVLANLSSCATPPDPLHNQDPFVRQILMPRKGYEPMLTNRTCKAKDAGNVCTEWTVATYDLRDSSVRETMIKNSFSCLVGGKLYQVCESTASLCHQRYVKDTTDCGFLGLFCKKKPVSDIVSLEKQYQFLIDSGTECASDVHHSVLGFTR